ncbi:MAG: tetratricopeptide repeat protein [Treponema sp.]|nr:tetratricopeptide repeat protein [Treponema sp.]
MGNSWVWILCALLFFSCGSSSEVKETPVRGPVSGAVETGTDPGSRRPSGGGLADEIRGLIEKGTPSSLLSALDTIRGRNLGGGEFGRIMNAAATLIIRRLYPDIRAQLPPVDLPRTHAYTRLIQEAEAGNYLLPPSESGDYLEYTLPFLALFSAGSSDPPSGAVTALEKAERLNPASVLAPYFLGLLYERRGDLSSSAAAYERAYKISEDCYPAILALIRIRSLKGDKQETARELQDLVIRYPDNAAVKRFLARAYYEAGDWSRAESAIAEILQNERENGDFILMRAHVLVELGRFPQAQAPLDLYASINAQNPLYLFLRARVQAEGFRNRDAALNYLRAIMRSPASRAPSAQTDPVSGEGIVEEASVYAARLLMESSRAEDQREGQELLRQLTASASPPLAALSLAVRDGIRREDWREARDNLTRLLAERRGAQDLLDAYTVEHGLGNNAAALAYARELYERDRGNEDAAAAYISALIDTGRQSEAAGMINSRLESVSGGTLKSRYYYLRSRIRNDEEQILGDLRSSLFEDPRNLSALMAMFEYYHRHRDERRAVYYLRQALTIAPDNPQLKRYEREYAALLRAN